MIDTKWFRLVADEIILSRDPITLMTIININTFVDVYLKKQRDKICVAFK